MQRACEEIGLPQMCCALAATIEENGALEHSLAFAGMAKNSAGGIYKNDMTKPYKEKARVAQALTILSIGLLRCMGVNGTVSSSKSIQVRRQVDRMGVVA